jgi:CheY-like chemotaxis protein
MRTLLVVDDDRDVTEVLAEVLRDEGYQVDIARNGEEALRFVDEGMPHFPDAVLLDVEMPVLDGPSTAYRLFVTDLGRENIPIVLLAGITNLPKIAALVGTPYFLEKPFALSGLLALVARALTERLPPRPALALGNAARQVGETHVGLTNVGPETR